MNTNVECELEECKWNDHKSCTREIVILVNAKQLWDGCKPSLVCDDYEEE